MNKLALVCVIGFLSLSAQAQPLPTCAPSEILIREGHPYNFVCVPNGTYVLQVQCDTADSQLKFAVPYITPGKPKNLVDGPNFDLLGYYASSKETLTLSGEIRASTNFVITNEFEILVSVYNDPQNRSFKLSLNNGLVSLEGIEQNIQNCQIVKTPYSTMTP